MQFVTYVARFFPLHNMVKKMHSMDKNNLLERRALVKQSNNASIIMFPITKRSTAPGVYTPKRMPMDEIF